MKKFLLLFVLLVVVFSLLSCSSEKTNETITNTDGVEDSIVYQSPEAFSTQQSDFLNISVLFYYDFGCPRQNGLDPSETITLKVRNGDYYSIELPEKDGYVMYWKQGYYSEGVEDEYEINGIAKNEEHYIVHYKYVKEDLMTVSFIILEDNSTRTIVDEKYYPIVNNSVSFILPEYEGCVLANNFAYDKSNFIIEDGVVYITDIYKSIEGENVLNMSKHIQIFYCSDSNY